MHRGHPYFPRPLMPPLADQVGYCMENIPVASVFNDGFVIPSGIKPPMPFQNVVDIPPFDSCPRNFTTFDRSNYRSHIMFHPEMDSKLLYPGIDADTPIFQSDVDCKDVHDERRMTSQLKEDSDDIDAFLSTEYEPNEECDDDEVSTARTDAVFECKSPDSCSNYESQSRKSRSFFRKSSGSCSDDKKRQRTRRMVKALRGIVPGAKRMSTIAVLDEAVRYLKSLRVEVQKLGVEDSKS